MSFTSELIFKARDFIWTGPLAILLVSVGLYQTFQLRGIQFRCLGRSLKMIFRPTDHKAEGDISSFQSLMTALAGAIGTGNVAGIATAVAIGGFGSLFWMWLIAFLGMATAYSEALLAVKFRVSNENGAMAGGPMYALERGLKARKLAIAYALFGAIAALGTGCMVQSNSVANAVSVVLPNQHFSTGIIMMVLTGTVILGGIASIGRVAGVLVPLMAVLYLCAGASVLIYHHDRLWDALQLIFTSAFTGQAATGGFVGSTMILAIQFGLSKGLFSNEAGLGTLSIAASTAKTSHSAKQGLLAISGVFISTILVCSITGLVLAVTQVLGLYGADGTLLNGSSMAMTAFASVWSPLKYLVLIGLILFAFTTVLAWAYYGEKCMEYLFGLRVAYFYRWIYTAAILVGAVLNLELVWGIADLANGFMAIPNLIAIVGLSQVVRQETKLYFEQTSSKTLKTFQETSDLQES